VDAPISLRSERLLFRRPAAQDAEAIFARYSSDPEVTKYVGWPRHRSLDDARAYVASSQVEWQRDQLGAYLVFRSDQLIGGTGLHGDRAGRVSTGYVLAQDAWGQGHATEALRSMVGLAMQLGIQAVHACCHARHVRSRRVLDKGGFVLVDTQRCGANFPQLPAGEDSLVCNYVWTSRTQQEPR
jgi:ribosomal-protein-alanine N-acetyltransferase